jgi:hypothetical protein
MELFDLDDYENIEEKKNPPEKEEEKKEENKSEEEEEEEKSDSKMRTIKTIASKAAENKDTIINFAKKIFN